MHFGTILTDCLSHAVIMSLTLDAKQGKGSGVLILQISTSDIRYASDKIFQIRSSDTV